MALVKRFKTKYGGYAQYWKITGFDFDVLQQKGHIIITPYISEASRRNGGSGVESDQMSILIADKDYTGTLYEDLTSTDYTKYFGGAAMEKNIYEAMYEYVKGNVPFFKTAKDG